MMIDDLVPGDREQPGPKPVGTTVEPIESTGHGRPHLAGAVVCHLSRNLGSEVAQQHRLEVPEQ
jgi:hypothetical protein